MRTMLRLGMIPVAVMLLASCGPKDDAGTETVATPGPSDKTLSSTLQGEGDYGALSKIVANTGLTTALDGVGPYTVFAPPENVIRAGGDFADPALKAEGAALVRAHIVPGTLTRADIDAAIDRAPDKGAQMRSMAGALLTFTRDGQDIVATAPDGARAHLTGAEKLVKNGVLQPVDAMLVRPVAPPTG